VDCGKEVEEVEIDAIDIRCPNCEYRLNINRSIKKVSEYCVITLGILILGMIIFGKIINLFD
jgi:DNA-directed RNA polymerase subunit RPC12/RpoP